MEVGFYLGGGSLLITNFTIADNKAIGGSGSVGGDGKSPFGNGGRGGDGAPGLGGGIYFAFGQLTVVNSSFVGNEVRGGNGAKGCAGIGDVRERAADLTLCRLCGRW